MKGMAAVVNRTEEALRPGRAWPRILQPRAARGTAEPAPEPPPPGHDEAGTLEPTIYRFVLRHSIPQQLILLAFTLASFPFLYFSVYLPKTIVNNAIAGKNFPWKLLGIEFPRIGYLL